MSTVKRADRNYKKAHSELIAQLEGVRKVLLFGHKSPDGDSMGSTLGMRLILRELGCEVAVAMSGDIPHNLRWLPGAEEILLLEREREQIVHALRTADLILCLDFNAIYRTGKILEEEIRSALSSRSVPLLMIDHHLDPSDEFSWQWSCPEASATAEIVARLFYNEALGQVDVLPDTATCLLTGIVTDTGLFNHNSSSPELFELVGALLRSGADKELVVDRVFHNFKSNRQRLEGYILYEKVHLCPDIAAAYFTLTLEELNRFQVSSGDTDGLVNKPLDIEGITCSAFFRETMDEGIKVSTRSIGDIAVNELCRECFGGGGHKNASGGELPHATMEEAVELFLNYMRTHYAVDRK